MTKSPTKKDIAAENRALNFFDNMCLLIESTSPAFIQVNIEDILKTSLSPTGKEHVAEYARVMVEKAKTNPKIQLPEEWVKLLTLDE